MRLVLIAALIATAAQGMLVAAPAIAEAAVAPAALSVETTDLGSLLDNPAAKAVLAKHIPDLIGNEQIAMARGMTLKQLQGFAGDMLTDEKLASIQADLDKLPRK